ncbi:MAG: protein phosphatase 2C domain-containing protein [Micropruina sp.]|nr:protein phosphatase 2C domain-containing protein [Micropruina sp.]
MTTDANWPLFTAPPPADPVRPFTVGDAPGCPRCGRVPLAGERFCEQCGTPLPAHPGASALDLDADPAPTLPDTLPSADASPPNQPTGGTGGEPLEPVARPCVECGGIVDGDGYCQTCGTKAASPRDHFEQAPATWVGGVCDRGISHHRNEDALALWAAEEDEQRAVLVVCDGVSTSTDSDVASLAAAQRAVAVLQVNQPAGLGIAASQDAALAAALTRATAQANAAVIDNSVEGESPASCTFAAALVVAGRIHHASLGDSRVYWIGDTERRQLSQDDSLAQELMSQGVARAEAESHPQAHAITKWLGRDAQGIEPSIGTWDVVEDGWLLVCSDGLWNYASAAEDLGLQVDAACAESSEPVAVARRLVAWANSQGGKDNITVALARCRANLPSAQSIL